MDQSYDSLVTDLENMVASPKETNMVDSTKETNMDDSTKESNMDDSTKEGQKKVPTEVMRGIKPLKSVKQKKPKGTTKTSPNTKNVDTPQLGEFGQQSNSTGGPVKSTNKGVRKEKKPYQKKAENAEIRKEIAALKLELARLNGEHSGAASLPDGPAVQLASSPVQTAATPGVQSNGASLSTQKTTKKSHPPKFQRSAIPFLNHGPTLTSVLITCKEFNRENKKEMQEVYNLKCGPDQIGQKLANKKELFIVKTIKEDLLHETLQNVSLVGFKGYEVKAKLFKSEFPYMLPEICLFSDNW